MQHRFVLIEQPKVLKVSCYHKSQTKKGEKKRFDKNKYGTKEGSYSTQQARFVPYISNKQ